MKTYCSCTEQETYGESGPCPSTDWTLCSVTKQLDANSVAVLNARGLLTKTGCSLCYFLRLAAVRSVLATELNARLVSILMMFVDFIH